MPMNVCNELLFIDPDASDILCTSEIFIFQHFLPLRFAVKRRRPGKPVHGNIQNFVIFQVKIEKRPELGEKKAWAVGLNALQIQDCSICMIYNFIQFLSETIQMEYQCTDKKAEKKYAENLAKRFPNAQALGRSIHPLLIFSRFISRISSQFIRVVRNHFSTEKPLRFIVPIFIQRLEAYL